MTDVEEDFKLINFSKCRRDQVIASLQALEITPPKGKGLPVLVELLKKRYHDDWAKKLVTLAECDSCDAAGPVDLEACPFCGEPNEAPPVLKVAVDRNSDHEACSAPEAAVDRSSEGMPPIHDAGREFPLLTGEDLAVLVESMRTHGFDTSHPVTMFDGSIVDGVNRYRAALLAGVTPATRELEADVNPWDFAWRENGARRHMEPLQRAAVRLRILERSDGWQRNTKARAEQLASRRDPTTGRAVAQPASRDTGGRAREVLAREANVSPATAQRALDLKRKDPERFDRVAAGEALPRAPKPQKAPTIEAEEIRDLARRIRAAPDVVRLGNFDDLSSKELRILGRALEGLHDALAVVLGRTCHERHTVPLAKLRGQTTGEKDSRKPTKKTTKKAPTKATRKAKRRHA